MKFSKLFENKYISKRNRYDREMLDQVTRMLDDYQSENSRTAQLRSRFYGKNDQAMPITQNHSTKRPIPHEDEFASQEELPVLNSEEPILLGDADDQDIQDTHNVQDAEYTEIPDESDVVQKDNVQKDAGNEPIQQQIQEPVQVSKEEPKDYFLDDDVFNNCKRSLSDKLGVDFVPETYDDASNSELLETPENSEDPEILNSEQNKAGSTDAVNLVTERPKSDYFLNDPEDLEQSNQTNTSNNTNETDVPDDLVTNEPPSEEPEKSELQKDIITQEPEVSAVPETPKPKRRKKKKVVTEESKESKDLKDAVSDVKVSDENPEAIKVYNELINTIQGKDYGDSVEFIDDVVKDPKLKFLLSLGFGGDFSNLKLKIKKTTISAKRLIPTQNEIGVEDTFNHLVRGDSIDVCFARSVIIKRPIVTFQGTFIIDGHHRWSQAFVTNPDANLVCVDITGNLSPISMLKAVQCTIASNIGHLIHKDAKGANLYTMSEKDIKKYFIKNLSDVAAESLKKYYSNPIESLTKNAIQLQQNNMPILNAPDRGEMPQTTKDPELFDDLKNGVTEV